MDIFDNPYFRLNKKLFRIIGLWPCDSKRKAIQVCWLILILVMTVPHVTAIIVDISDMDKVLEHLCISLILGQTFLKYVTLIAADNKMKIMFDEIGKNWLSFIDEEEKRILVAYSKRGRVITMAYLCMLLITAATFMVIPIVPELLNAIDPLPIPRPHLYVLNGEFLLENRDDHFFKIYLWDSASIMIVVVLFLSMDPMYMVIVEQGTALYAILTHRLPKLRQKPVGDSQNESNSSYDCLVHIIKLHQTVLSFTSNINDSYSECFFCLTVINIVHLPVTCVVIMVHWHDLVNLIRYGFSLTCLMIHVFALFWPGQRLINHSARLLDDAYCNNWYETPEKTKKLLRIFMLRCSEPCTMTAGGLMEMNFEAYLKIVKTAASYITVLASFR